MANICCDDVQFHPGTNPEGLQELWKDLEASIILCPDSTRAALYNLFRYKGISVTGINLRGTVAYMERNADRVLLDLESAWVPLYDAYCAIAKAYGVTFVLKSIEPGEEIFINTDSTGRFFPEKYFICIYDENMATPSGTKICKVLEDWGVYESDTKLLESFHKLGYCAATIEELNRILDEDEICIHQFENPYPCEYTVA